MSVENNIFFIDMMSGMFTVVLCFCIGSSVNAPHDVSEKTALEMFSSDLTELELGTDEVFVNVSPAKLPISPHTVSISHLTRMCLSRRLKVSPVLTCMFHFSSA